MTAGDDGDHPEITDCVFDLENLIAVAPTLAGAEVKLRRRLADPEIRLVAGICTRDTGSVRHVLDAIERELGLRRCRPGKGARADGFPAEPDAIGFGEPEPRPIISAPGAFRLRA
jgi:hypothetical protein